MRTIYAVVWLLAGCASGAGDVDDVAPIPPPIVVRDAGRDAPVPVPDAGADAPAETRPEDRWGTLGYACTPWSRGCVASRCFTARTVYEPFYRYSDHTGDLYMTCTVDCAAGSGRETCEAAGGECVELTREYPDTLPSVPCLIRMAN